MEWVQLYSHLNPNYFNYQTLVVLNGTNKGVISKWVRHTGDPEHKVEGKMENNPFFFLRHIF